MISTFEEYERIRRKGTIWEKIEMKFLDVVQMNDDVMHPAEIGTTKRDIIDQVLNNIPNVNGEMEMYVSALIDNIWDKEEWEDV